MYCFSATKDSIPLNFILSSPLYRFTGRTFSVFGKITFSVVRDRAHDTEMVRDMDSFSGA
jgi:hypothetical protein